MSDFSTDLSELTQRLNDNRADLLSAVSDLKDADLVLARRGGWSVAKVLEHIVGAEWHYAQLVATLRGQAPVTAETFTATDISAVASGLDHARTALLSAVDGVSEDDFYRLGTFGREEYSIVSVLENAEQHDSEHLAQIRLIQAEVTTTA